MRAYSTASEESLHQRNLLKDWFDEGFLTESQYQRMQQETVCDLRRTNIFLRFVLFFFTLIIVGAATGLLLTSNFSAAPLLVCGAVCYGCAEYAVAQYRLYRHGIEEALAVCSVGFLCAGVAVLWKVDFLVAAVGMAASLWLWQRFGFAYAFLAALIFAVWLPNSFTGSHSARHLVLTLIYAAGLIALTSLNRKYSLPEAFLWFGLYLAINLQISANLVSRRWGVPTDASEFTSTFYWFTWVLTWGVPAVALWRGLNRKDHFIIATGGITAVLTFVTNKSYLGWQRHTWDPMLLGALLAGIAVLAQRYLSSGPSGIRHGFTARRFSGKDKQWIDAGSLAFGLAAPNSSTVNSQPQSSDHRFGGGESGGGGASSDF